MSGQVLAVDGGQTSTRVVSATLDGRVVWHSRVGSAFPDLGHDWIASLEQRLGQLLEQAVLPAIRAEAPFRIAVLGMSGAEPGSPLIPSFRRAVSAVIPAERYLVVHDAVTNLMGASAGQPGIVVIAGGGAVAYGVTAEGRSWASGGWGYAVGDEGSGYNIGRAAVNAAFRAFDGRDAPTLLTGRVLGHFQIPHPVDLKYAILAGRIRFQDLVGLPPIVAEVASSGDPAARRILQLAGRELAEAAISVARALDLGAGSVDIYLTGGLMRETRYLVPAFEESVLQALPRATFPEPAFEPVAGALFLAYRELGRSIDPPLLRQVSKSWVAIRGDDQ